MTSQQRSLLVVLGLANALLLCCVAPAAHLLLTQTPDQDPLQSTLDVLQSAFLSPPTSADIGAPNPIPTLEAGWKLYTVPSDSFAIALPPGWKQFAPNPADVIAGMDAFKKKNPEFADALDTQDSSVAPYIRFIGVDSAPEGMVGNFSTNVNVLHRTQPIGAPLDVYVPITLKALQDLPYVGRPILQRRFQTLAGQAEEFRYHNTLKLLNDANVTTANWQYVLVRGREFYVISGSTPLKQEDHYAPIFEKIAASFRWTGK